MFSLFLFMIGCAKIAGTKVIEGVGNGHKQSAEFS